VTLRGGLAVDAEPGERVAAVARDVVIPREARVVVELAAELDLRLGDGVGLRRGFRRQRPEDLLRLARQLAWFPGESAFGTLQNDGP
jgi:hypothetical protein